MLFFITNRILFNFFTNRSFSHSKIKSESYDILIICKFGDSVSSLKSINQYEFPTNFIVAALSEPAFEITLGYF